MGLLTVDNLKTHYFTKAGIIRAVDGISFSLKKGESLGIAGESGCGKSTIAMSIMRLIKGGKIVSGQITMEGLQLLNLNEKEVNKFRWNKISIITQAAMGGLNPVYNIGSQIAEVLIVHKKMKKTKALEKARELLAKVEIDPKRAKDYPHELSGGMRQRSMIAMALALDPDIVIADEPTTALDVVTQARIIMLIKKLQEEMGLSVIFISHDLSILAQICDKVLIMYAGKILEKGEVKRLFQSPGHPYTKALLNSFPDIKSKNRKLRGLAGSPPDLLNARTGCRFFSRCHMPDDICKNVEPRLHEISPNHFAACHNAAGNKFTGPDKPGDCT